MTWTNPRIGIQLIENIPFVYLLNKFNGAKVKFAEVLLPLMFKEQVENWMNQIRDIRERS